MTKQIFQEHRSLVSLMLSMFLLFVFAFQANTIYSQTDADKNQNEFLADLRIINDESVKIIDAGKVKDPSIGVWQYPNRAFWIIVDESKKVVECYITKNGNVYKNFGKLIDNKTVWDGLSETDRLKIQKNDLFETGKGKGFKLVRVDRIPDSRCQPPFRETNSGQVKSSGKGQVSGSGIGIGSGSPQKSDGNTRGVQIISKPQPRYTNEAQEANVEGRITLRVTFLENGTIGSVSALNRLPYGLTEQAIAAAKRIQFRPATKNGQPITSVLRIQYSFVIPD